MCFSCTFHNWTKLGRRKSCCHLLSQTILQPMVELHIPQRSCHSMSTTCLNLLILMHWCSTAPLNIVIDLQLFCQVFTLLKYMQWAKLTSHHISKHNEEASDVFLCVRKDARALMRISRNRSIIFPPGMLSFAPCTLPGALSMSDSWPYEPPHFSPVVWSKPRENSKRTY